MVELDNAFVAIDLIQTIYFATGGLAGEHVNIIFRDGLQSIYPCSKEQWEKAKEQLRQWGRGGVGQN